jgi:hypothetical protein
VVIEEVVGDILEFPSIPLRIAPLFCADDPLFLPLSLLYRATS